MMCLWIILLHAAAVLFYMISFRSDAVPCRHSRAPSIPEAAEGDVPKRKTQRRQRKCIQNKSRTKEANIFRVDPAPPLLHSL